MRCSPRRCCSALTRRCITPCGCPCFRCAKSASRTSSRTSRRRRSKRSSRARSWAISSRSICRVRARVSKNCRGCATSTSGANGRTASKSRSRNTCRLARWGRAGLVNTFGELFVAAADGDLPLFIGPPESAKEIAIQYGYFKRSLATLGLTPVQVQVSPRRAWQVKLASGTTLQLGRDNIEPRLDRFIAVYPPHDRPAAAPPHLRRPALSEWIRRGHTRTRARAGGAAARA